MNSVENRNSEYGCVMKKFGCKLCNVKARRLCTNLLYKGGITIASLALLAALGYFMQTCKGIVLGVFFYLSVMFNAGWFFYLLAPVVRIRLFNALLFMGLFVWGCMLYFCSPVREGDYNQSIIERQIEAPNRTVAAFFPSRGGFESIAKFNDRQLRIHYFAFHTVVLFYVALLMFSIFGRGIVNRVRKWLTPWRRLNVFWGRTDVGLLLARNITNTTVRGQVFFMLQQHSGDGDEWRTLTQDIDRMDAMWSFTYDSNAVETDVSKDTLAQAKGRRHFFMDESGHVNVSRADRLVKVLKKWKEMRSKRGKVRCFFAAARAGILRWWLTGCAEKPYFYVRVEASTDDLTYQTWAANVRDVVTPVLVRESQLIAKDFIKNHPLLNMPGIHVDHETGMVQNGRFNVLLIGFGAVGQDILNEIVCNGQFVQSYKDGKPVQVPLHVDIVEQDAKVIEEYCVRRPLATRHPKFSATECGDERFDVNFVEESVRVEEKTFDDWFRNYLDNEWKKKQNPYNRIIVCLQGDGKSLAIANKIVEFARRNGVEIGPNVVFARVKDPAINRYLPQGKICTLFTKEQKPDKQSRITVFGDLVGIYAFDRINVEFVDTMAKVLNSRYGNFGREVADEKGREEKWENASFFDQLSSRAAAEGQRNLLLLRGLDYRVNVRRLFTEITYADVDAPMTDDSFKDKDSLLRTLSIDEHLRWNAFHIMMGYRPWYVLDEDRKRVGLSGAVRDDIPEPRPKKIKANQLATIGKHADIVPFDALPDVDMRLKEWNAGKTLAELKMERKDFEGLTPDSAQAWDIAFCQIVGKAAQVAGLAIVKPVPLEA